MRAQPAASHFINGKPTEDAAGALLESRYPATGEVIAEAAPDFSALRMERWQVSL